MDQETRDYMDQKVVTLARKEDIEKLRQEMKNTFRQWKEETKQQANDGKQDVHNLVEEAKKQWKTESASLSEAFLKEMKRWKDETRSSMTPSSIDGMVKKIQEELKAGSDRSKRDMEAVLHVAKEGSQKEVLPVLQESRKELQGLKGGMTSLEERVNQIASDLRESTESIRASLGDVKGELGAMIKFSFADLERRLNTLEVRIQVLEKIVLQQP